MQHQRAVIQEAGPSVFVSAKNRSHCSSVLDEVVREVFHEAKPAEALLACELLQFCIRNDVPLVSRVLEITITASQADR